MIEKWKLLKKVNADQKLNDAARRVMFFLLDRENNKTKKLFPSHARLSDDTGLSRSSIKRGVANLINNGYLTRLKKGYVGRATEYKINYHVSHSEKGIIIEPKGVHNWTQRGSELSHQLTNELTNKLTKVEGSNMTTIKEEEKKKVANILKNLTKGFNINYRNVSDGNKRKYLDPESIRQRYVQKTGDYKASIEWKAKYLNPKTSEEAWNIAVYLGIVKDYKKK